MAKSLKIYILWLVDSIGVKVRFKYYNTLDLWLDTSGGWLDGMELDNVDDGPLQVSIMSFYLDMMMAYMMDFYFVLMVDY